MTKKMYKMVEPCNCDWCEEIDFVVSIRPEWYETGLGICLCRKCLLEAVGMLGEGKQP